MTNIIDQSKARMAELMRDGVTLTFLYQAGRAVRLTPEQLLKDAIGAEDAGRIVRLIYSNDAVELLRVLRAATDKHIAEVCDDEVAEWLAYQAKAKEDAA